MASDAARGHHAAPRPAEDERRRRRRLLLFLALLAAPPAAIFLGSAWDAEGGFEPDPVVIVVAPVKAAIALERMAPGDAVTAPLVVTNAGRAPLRYALASTTDDRFLSQALELTIKAGVERCSNRGFGRSGDLVYGPGPLGTRTGAVLVGPNAGADSSRTLAPGENDELCFQVRLPLYVGSTFANADSTAVFCFAPAERISAQLAEAGGREPIPC